MDKSISRRDFLRGMGVLCGLDDLEGKTGIEGLWVSDDGMMACGPTGDCPACGGVNFSKGSTVEGIESLMNRSIEVDGKSCIEYNNFLRQHPTIRLRHHPESLRPAFVSDS